MPLHKPKTKLISDVEAQATMEGIRSLSSSTSEASDINETTNDLTVDTVSGYGSAAPCSPSSTLSEDYLSDHKNASPREDLKGLLKKSFQPCLLACLPACLSVCLFRFLFACSQGMLLWIQDYFGYFFAISKYRVSSNLENLEYSGNLICLRENLENLENSGNFSACL